MAEKMRKISDEEKLRPNYAEYLVERKDSKSLLKKAGIVLGALVLIVLEFVFLANFPWAMLPLLVGTMALCWFLWRFANLEYEYIIIQATVEFHRIYGERSRKKVHEIKTSDIEKVAPVAEHPEVKDEQYAEVYDFSDGKNNHDTLFFILYNGEKGKSIIYINAIKKTLDVFKYYKSTAVEYGNIK